MNKKVSSLTEGSSSVSMERANLRADLDEMMALVQRMKENIRKGMFAVFTKVQMKYDDMADVFNRKMQHDHR